MFFSQYSGKQHIRKVQTNLIRSVPDVLVSTGDIQNSGLVKLSSHNHHTNW